MRTYSGESLKAKSSIGILTDNTDSIPRGNHILYKDNLSLSDFGFRGYVTKDNKLPLLSKSGLKLPDELDLSHHIGDIVKISEDGQIHVLWENSCSQNAFYLTDACNVNCIMCPQPQKPHDKIHIDTARSVLDLLVGQKVEHMCITGGEPTIIKDNFLEIIARCTTEHPDASLQILTNGQTLNEFEFAKRCAELSTPKTCYCVSMHGDTPLTHDLIVRRDNAFSKVHSSLYNLSKLNVGIEVRFVVSKLNYTRLPGLAEFFFRTYPFVHHFAIMGLEMTGCAAKNVDEVWIDPMDYREELDRFVLEAERRAINFSIYNHQLCVIPERARKHAKRSISDWKCKHIPVCDKCMIQGECGGFFTTSNNLISKGIQPVCL